MMCRGASRPSTIWKSFHGRRIDPRCKSFIAGHTTASQGQVSGPGPVFVLKGLRQEGYFRGTICLARFKVDMRSAPYSGRVTYRRVVDNSRRRPESPMRCAISPSKWIWNSQVPMRCRESHIIPQMFLA